VSGSSGAATGTGASGAPSPEVGATAQAATGAGAAHNATVSVSGAATNANAGLASGIGTAYGVTVLKPIWTTPPDLVEIVTSPELKFLMPNLPAAQHFNMQIDTSAAFNTGDLREIRSDLSQVGWDFWNGAGWEPVAPTGVPAAYVGNEARYTVQTPLATGTWFRRVRAGS